MVRNVLTGAAVRLFGDDCASRLAIISRTRVRFQRQLANSKLTFDSHSFGIAMHSQAVVDESTPALALSSRSTVARRGLGVVCRGTTSVPAGTVIMSIPMARLLVESAVGATAAADAEQAMAKRLSAARADPQHVLYPLVSYYAATYASEWHGWGHPIATDWQSYAVKTRCHHHQHHDASSGSSAQVTLVPMFDFLNHSGHPTVHYATLNESNGEDGAARRVCINYAAGVPEAALTLEHLYVVTLRDVEPGEEFTYLYGDFDPCRSEEWRAYGGFVPCGADLKPAMTSSDAAALARGHLDRFLLRSYAST